MNTWTVDPAEGWLATNQRWLPEANLPGTALCDTTLTGLRCELIAGHDCEHMVHIARPKITNDPVTI